MRCVGEVTRMGGEGNWSDGPSMVVMQFAKRWGAMPCRCSSPLQRWVSSTCAEAAVPDSNAGSLGQQYGFVKSKSI